MPLYQNEDATFTATFERLPDGATYLATVELKYPKGAIEVLIQNSNYQRLVAALSPASRVRFRP